MAKFAIFASALAVLAPLASARNCTPGLVYCGQVLYDIGAYDGQVIAALRDAGRPTDNSYKKNSLFYCDGGSDGAIHFIAKCNTCHNGGTGHSDHC